MDYTSYGTPRVDIGDALQEYLINQTDYIGPKVLPVTPVGAEAGQYSCIVRETLTEMLNTIVGPNGDYPEAGLKAEDVTFACQEHGLKSLVRDKDRRKYKNDFDLEMKKAYKILHALLLKAEYDAAAVLINTGTFTGASLYLDTTGVWSTTTTDIIGDVQAAKRAILANTGMAANSLVLNETVLTYVLNNDDIVGRVQYSAIAGQDAVLKALASILGLKNVFVGKAVQNGKPEGATAFAASQIWSNSYASVLYVPESGAVEEPAVGRNFLWTEDSPNWVVSESYRDDDRRGDWVRVRQNRDTKLIDKYFGFLLKID